MKSKYLEQDDKEPVFTVVKSLYKKIKNTPNDSRDKQGRLRSDNLHLRGKKKQIANSYGRTAQSSNSQRWGKLKLKRKSHLNLQK